VGCGGECGLRVTVFDGNVNNLPGHRDRDYTLTSRSHNHSLNQRRAKEPPSERKPGKCDDHVLE